MADTDERARTQQGLACPAGFIRVMVQPLFDELFITEKAPKLEPTDFKLLVYLMCQMEYRGWINIPQIQMAKALHMAPETLNRSIKRLEARNILQRGEKSSVFRPLELNPSLLQKGRKDDQIKAMEYFERSSAINRRTKQLKASTKGDLEIPTAEGTAWKMLGAEPTPLSFGVIDLFADEAAPELDKEGAS